MDILASVTVLIGRISPENVLMLGTAFLIGEEGYIVTPKHVVGDTDKGLVVLWPHFNFIDEYQDVSNLRANYSEVEICEVDPIRDIAILRVKAKGILENIPKIKIGSLDDVTVGSTVGILGYPHCTDGRRVITFQQTIVGAKILLTSNGIQSKCAVLNIQSRPGQSGSVIFSEKGTILGMLLGTYAPSTGVSIAGINPAELNQTTQIISAEYIKEMI